MTTKQSFIILLLTGLVSIYSTCKKDLLGCAETVYNFQIGVHEYSGKESVLIGDTVWFEINAPTSLNDKITNTIINYSGAQNLGCAIAFEKIINPTTFENSTHSFEYLLVDGTEMHNPNTQLIREYLFKEKNEKYVFKLGIIPNEVGIFAVVFSNATRVYRINDKCTKASFEINFVETNQHYYLNPNFQPGTSPTGGDYYFKVD